MSRSFGDYVASQVGVICIPDIIEFDLSEDDRFLLLASDGIWEFLSNEDVGKIIIPFYNNKDAVGAANKLVSISRVRW